MNILIISALLGVSMVGTAILAIMFHRSKRRHRELLEFLGKRVDDLEQDLSQSRELLDTGSQKFADQARRIAWLESRIRKPRLLAEEASREEATVDANAKWNVTEKRHKVLNLASRGHGPDSIAATLGMMRGEVELIINLSRASAAASA